MHTFTIEPCEKFHILRDDLVAGGTKRRALDILFTRHCEETVPTKQSIHRLDYFTSPAMTENHIHYAGTIFGHGALALAHACDALGKTAHLYLSCNDQNHPMLERIRKTGAVIERCEPLPIEQLFQEIKGGYIFPLGFDTPEFHAAMATALKTFDMSAYPEIWCASVSGTLARAIRAAFPDTPLKMVAVARSAEADFHAPEKYHQPAKSPPPYPSCPYTDAKLWQFAHEHAAEGALIWNTAG